MHKTVYGHSFKPIDCVRHIYEENLEFRNRRRLVELSHQPFEWLCDYDPSPERLSCSEHIVTNSTSTKHVTSNWVAKQDAGTQTLALTSSPHRDNRGMPHRINKAMQTDSKFAVPSKVSSLPANASVPHPISAVNGSKGCMCKSHSKLLFNQSKCSDLKEKRYLTPTQRLSKGVRAIVSPAAQRNYGELSKSFPSERLQCRRPMSGVLSSALALEKPLEGVTVAPVPPPTAGQGPAVPKVGDLSVAPSATTAGRVRRRSTSSRSSRSIGSIRRRHVSRSLSSSRSSDRYYRRNRSRRSRLRNHSRSRSSHFRRRRRSSRTPSYQPPPIRRSRRPFGGLSRRYSPPVPVSRTRRRSPPPSQPYSRRPGAGDGGSARRRDSRSRSPAPGRFLQTRTAVADSPTAVAERLPLLSERFENQMIATMRQRRRDYGVLGGLAYLALTNKLKLPLPTLMREAKELSVVIERQLPIGVADPSAEVMYDINMAVKLAMPADPMAGHKPVFERPEVPSFSKPEDLEKISERLIASLTAKPEGDPRSLAILGDGNNNNTSNGQGTFGRSDRGRRGNAFNRLGPINPLDVPKGPSYFMHDDRDGSSFDDRRRNYGENYPRNDWRQRRTDVDRRDGKRRWGPREDGGDRTWGYRSARARAEEQVMDNGRWTHDKFMELEVEEEKSAVKKSGSGGRRHHRHHRHHEHRRGSHRAGSRHSRPSSSSSTRSSSRSRSNSTRSSASRGRRPK